MTHFYFVPSSSPSSPSSAWLGFHFNLHGDISKYLKFTLYLGSRLLLPPERERKKPTRKIIRKSAAIPASPSKALSYTMFFSCFMEKTQSTVITKICLALSSSICYSCCLSSILFMVCKYTFFSSDFPDQFQLNFTGKHSKKSIRNVSHWEFISIILPRIHSMHIGN